ncbi:hypothetical protein CR513_21255, partial [Mucuna pruriens]
MAEIRARAEKHIEVEEDQTERMAEEHLQTRKNEGRVAIQRTETSRRVETAHKDKHFTPLNEKRAQILREMCHTRLLRFPPASDGKILGNNQTEWCDFHRTTGHSTEACWTLKTQIERLIQEGRLNQYVSTRRQWTRREEGPDRRRSRSRQNSPVPHKGVISTIAGGTGTSSKTRPAKKRSPDRVNRSKLHPVGKTDTEADCRREEMGCDEPMVISVVARQYKIERVLIDQGSSANILYWTTAQKLGVRDLTKCEGVLYGFAGERVPIKGTVEIETTFGDKNGARTIPVTYTVVDSEASYNIIMGRSALNRLGAVVSIHHLCMKFPVGQTIATIWADITMARKCYEDSLKIELTAKEAEVNVLDIDLDPRYFSEEKRPHPVGDLKEVQIGFSASQKTSIGTTLDEKEEGQLIPTL